MNTLICNDMYVCYCSSEYFNVLSVLSGEAVDVNDVDSNDILWLSNLRCTGKERALVNCASDLLGTFRTECVTAGYAGTACFAEGNILLRYLSSNYNVLCMKTLILSWLQNDEV